MDAQGSPHLAGFDTRGQVHEHLHLRLVLAPLVGAAVQPQVWCYLDAFPLPVLPQRLPGLHRSRALTPRQAFVYECKFAWNGFISGWFIDK